MLLLQAVVVAGLVVASVAARRGAKRLERVVEDLELERAVFLGILVLSGWCGSPTLTRRGASAR